jgi:hypothetical protein
MFIDCGRIDVKEYAVSMLCEISHSNPNLITFDIYDMLRSYKITTSDMRLSHAIEITLQEIRQHCVHLHAQIDEYEKFMLPACYDNNNDNIESDYCENKYDVSINVNSDISSNVNNNPINYCLDSVKTSVSSRDDPSIKNDSNNYSNHNSNSEIENIMTLNDNKEYISQQEVSNDSNSYNNSSSSSSDVSLLAISDDDELDSSNSSSNISDDELDGSSISSSSSSTL